MASDFNRNAKKKSAISCSVAHSNQSGWGHILEFPLCSEGQGVAKGKLSPFSLRLDDPTKRGVQSFFGCCRSRLYLVRPAAAHICFGPIVAATLQLPGAGWCNGRRPAGETQCAQRCCDGGLVKHNAHKLHSSAAFITIEHVDFESAFEELCRGDAFSFAGLLLSA